MLGYDFGNTPHPHSTADIRTCAHMFGCRLFVNIDRNPVQGYGMSSHNK